MLQDFSKFWDAEPKAAERRKLIASLFDPVWEDEGRILAVRPREPFLRYARPPRTCPARRRQGRFQ